MRLMVAAGDSSRSLPDEVDAIRRSVLLARDEEPVEETEEPDTERRKEVRMLWGEKREVMDWKPGTCMVGSGGDVVVLVLL